MTTSLWPLNAAISIGVMPYLFLMFKSALNSDSSSLTMFWFPTLQAWWSGVLPVESLLFTLQLPLLSKALASLTCPNLTAVMSRL